MVGQFRLGVYEMKSRNPDVHLMRFLRQIHRDGLIVKDVSGEWFFNAPSGARISTDELRQIAAEIDSLNIVANEMKGNDHAI